MSNFDIELVVREAASEAMKPYDFPEGYEACRRVVQRIRERCDELIDNYCGSIRAVSAEDGLVKLREELKLP